MPASGLRVSMSPTERAGNPYTTLLTEALRRERMLVQDLRVPVPLTTDIVHVHWPEQVLFSRTRGRGLVKAATLAASIGVRLRRRPRLVWTAHNDLPHEWRLWPASKRRTYEAFLRHVDGLVHLSTTGRAAVERAFPFLQRRPSIVVDHGDLASAYPSVGRDAARVALGLRAEQRLILVFGHLRPYRQIQVVIDRFQELGASDARLLICGPCSDAAFGRTLRARASAVPGVDVEVGMLSPEALAVRLTAADLVVQPFEDVLHSGSVHLALGMARPVLAPSRGSLPELQRRMGEERLRLYTGALTTDVLRGALATPGPASPPDLGSWEEIAAQHADLYARLRARPVGSAGRRV